MKLCPYCAEEIQDAAIACKFCGRELVAFGPSPTVVLPSTNRRILGAGLLTVGILTFVMSEPASLPLLAGFALTWGGFAAFLSGSTIVRWGGGFILAGMALAIVSTAR